MCVIISRDFDLVVCVPIYEILLSLDEPIHTTHTTQHTHNKMHTHIHNRLKKKKVTIILFLFMKFLYLKTNYGNKYCFEQLSLYEGYECQLISVCHEFLVQLRFFSIFFLFS